MPDEKMKIGFVGGGQMCEAILAGLLAGGYAPGSLFVTDVNEDRLLYLRETYKVCTVLSGETGEGAVKLSQMCGVLMLCLKPQVAPAAVPQFAAKLPKDLLVISIMGGLTLEQLEEMMPNSPVVRAMPNTPMLLGKGVAALCKGKSAAKSDLRRAEDLFSICGSVYVVPEKQINAFSGTSGSGPAYVYMFIEAMADGGVENGLSRQLAIEVAAKTLAGAAEMVLQTGRHPAALKDAVTSPAGGTIAGIRALEAGGFRASVIDAVVAGRARMDELAGEAAK